MHGVHEAPERYRIARQCVKFRNMTEKFNNPEVNNFSEPLEQIKECQEKIIFYERNITEAQQDLEGMIQTLEDLELQLQSPNTKIDKERLDFLKNSVQNAIKSTQKGIEEFTVFKRRLEYNVEKLRNFDALLTNLVLRNYQDKN